MVVCDALVSHPAWKMYSCISPSVDANWCIACLFNKESYTKMVMSFIVLEKVVISLRIKNLERFGKLFAILYGILVCNIGLLFDLFVIVAFSSPSAKNSTLSSSYLVAFFFQIKYGGVVPKSYYIKNSVDVQYEKCITISRGSDHQLECEVLVPNCLLR